MSDLKLDVDQASEIKAAFRRGNWTNAEIKWASQGDFLERVRQVVLRRAKIVSLEEAQVYLPKSMTAEVCVDRSLRPLYPEEADQGRINDPEFFALENAGPEKFDAAKLRRFLHRKQRGFFQMKGGELHSYLSVRMLRSCLGFPELLAIMEEGDLFVRAYLIRGEKSYGRKRFYGWRTVIDMHQDTEDYFVPYIEVPEEEESTLKWGGVLRKLSVFGKNDVTLLFPR